MIYECEIGRVKELIYFLGLHVKQIRESIFVSQIKFGLEKIRGAIGNSMNENLLLSFLMKRANGNFLSLTIFPF